MNKCWIPPPPPPPQTFWSPSTGFAPKRERAGVKVLLLSAKTSSVLSASASHSAATRCPRGARTRVKNKRGRHAKYLCHWEWRILALTARQSACVCTRRPRHFRMTNCPTNRMGMGGACCGGACWITTNHPLWACLSFSMLHKRQEGGNKEWGGGGVSSSLKAPYTGPPQTEEEDFARVLGFLLTRPFLAFSGNVATPLFLFLWWITSNDDSHNM